MPSENERLFPEILNQSFETEEMDGCPAYFGTNVLRGLVEGIDDFAEGKHERWSQFRSMGPALLGSAMWIDDPELIQRLTSLAAACVVVTKQDRSKSKIEKLERLRGLNLTMPGLPLRSFARLGGLAPKVDGKAIIVGPYGPIDEHVLPTIRTVGFRKRGQLEPIMHAKIALLGNLWWHDEGPLGHVQEVFGFRAKRLWISSANFTSASRKSLEFGFWTENVALLDGAERFLLDVIACSEDVDPDSDTLEPELAYVEFDDDAFAEVMSQIRESAREMEEFEE